MFDIETDSGLDLAKLAPMGRERRQDGWVEKTGKKTKTWTGYFYEYVKCPDGTEKRLGRSKVLGKCAEMTKGAAEDALRSHIRMGRPQSQNATFEELANWYLKTKRGHVSKEWGQSLQALFKNQILPRLGGQIAAKLKQSDIQQAVDDIAADSRSQSLSIVNKAKTHICAVFEFAIDEEFLQRSPVRPRKLKMPKTRRPAERFLSLEECQRLMEIGTPRDQLILILLMVCGFRPSELFALRLNDLIPGALRIDQTYVEYEVKDQTKTEGSRGIVPIPPAVELAVREYIAAESITDFLFPSQVGSPISPDNYLDRVLKRLGVQAGIDVSHDKHGDLTSGLNFQIFRRTCATHFQNHGQIKDAQALLRHQRATTTLEHYQKAIPGSLAAAVESWYNQLSSREEPDPSKTDAKVVSIADRKRKLS